jgi:hypothetical protein
MRRIGPAYDLLGTRLQDVDAGCGHCGKRLAEVIDDTTGQWNTGQHVCIDCGQATRIPSLPSEPYALKPSYRAPGLRVACCQLCRWTSLPAPLEKAADLATRHLNEKHAA